MQRADAGMRTHARRCSYAHRQVVKQRGPIRHESYKLATLTLIDTCHEYS